MTVNKGLDFIERVGWTAIQAGAAAAITALTTDAITWATGLKIVGIAAAIAALKVIVAQNAGSSDLGALPDPSGGGVGRK
jgi:hypothetical protein